MKLISIVLLSCLVLLLQIHPTFSDCNNIVITCRNRKCIDAVCYECHKRSRNLHCPIYFSKFLEGNVGCTHPKKKRGCRIYNNYRKYLDDFCHRYRYGQMIITKTKDEVEGQMPDILQESLMFAKHESFGGMTIYSDAYTNCRWYHTI